MTQTELADQIGVDSTLVSKWENGHRQPDATELEAWAKALKLPVSRMFSDAIDPPDETGSFPVIGETHPEPVEALQ